MRFAHRWTFRFLLGFLFALAMLPSIAAQEMTNAEKPRQSPNEALSSAQTIYIRSKSVYFKPEGLENSLLQRQEFQDWGLAITRDEADADLIIEVGRKVFTTSFIFSVIDTRNNRVVASGRVNSIGGTVEGKISDSLIKRLRLARSQTEQRN
jgi:hypothetical protein